MGRESEWGEVDERTQPDRIVQMFAFFNSNPSHSFPSPPTLHSFHISSSSPLYAVVELGKKLQPNKYEIRKRSNYAYQQHQRFETAGRSGHIQIDFCRRVQEEWHESVQLARGGQHSTLYLYRLRLARFVNKIKFWIKLISWFLSHFIHKISRLVAYSELSKLRSFLYPFESSLNINIQCSSRHWHSWQEVVPLYCVIFVVYVW